MTIIRAISAAVAIITVFRFTEQVKTRLARHRVMLKLVAFKLIILLNFVQTVSSLHRKSLSPAHIACQLVFSFAGARFTPSTTLSYLDLTVSLPAIIFCLEMVIFSTIFHFVYSYSPYLTKRQSGRSAYRGGPLGLFALGTAFSPVDIVSGIIVGF